MTFNQLIAKRIRRLLNERKWTQHKLSIQSGLPRSTISYTLTGRGNSFKTATILNICRGFEINVIDFFNDDSFRAENIDDN